MHTLILYILSLALLFTAVIKFNKRKSEWMVLLIILSFFQTCISMLFTASDVFALMSLGGIQFHLKDIIMILMFVYLCISLFQKFRATDYTMCILLLAVPFAITFIRGLLAGTFGSEVFFGDVRKYMSFMIALMSCYFLIRKDYAYKRLYKYEEYINISMAAVFVFTVIVWILDLGFGMNSLPGQIAGTLSDGGSTLRIIPASHSFLIALYTLYIMYDDIMQKHQLSIKTVAFAGLVILLQHRSVVAAFLVCAVIIFALSIKKNGLSVKLGTQIFALAAVGTAVALMGVGDITAMIYNLFESFANIKKGTGTFSTRTQVWAMILSSLDGFENVIGKPFGQALNISWKYSAHSAYIDWTSKTGYLGLALFVIFLLYVFYKAFNQKNYIVMIITIALAIYWMAYGMNIEQGAIMGVILAVLEKNDARYKDDEYAKELEELNLNI